MINKDLINFIISQQKMGVKPEKLRMDLLASDWTDADIDEALASIPKEKKKAKTRKIYFIILLLVILGAMYFLKTKKEVPVEEPFMVQFPDLTPHDGIAP